VATDLQITRQTSAEDNEEGEEGEREDALPSSSSNNPNSLSKMRRLALCSSVSTPSFSLYDIDAKQVIGKFIGHTATVTTIKRDGDLVLSGGDDQTIRVWELATLKCIHVFSLEGIVYDIRLCENKLVTGVTGSHMSFLRIWDYTSRAHLLDVKITDLPRRIFSITVLPDRIYCCTCQHWLLLMRPLFRRGGQTSTPASQREASWQGKLCIPVEHFNCAWCRAFSFSLLCLSI
jgi:WD40 repeat protein